MCAGPPPIGPGPCPSGGPCTIIVACWDECGGADGGGPPAGGICAGPPPIGPGPLGGTIVAATAIGECAAGGGPAGGGPAGGGPAGGRAAGGGLAGDGGICTPGAGWAPFDCMSLSRSEACQPMTVLAWAPAGAGGCLLPQNTQ